MVPVKDFAKFEDVPVYAQAKIVENIKSCIKKAYDEAGPDSDGFFYLSTNDLHECLVVAGEDVETPSYTYYRVDIETKDIKKQINEYCASLFGPHVPYIHTYDGGRGIRFVKNL